MTGTGAPSSYGYHAADRLGSVSEGTAKATTEAYDPSGDPTALADGTTQVFDSAGEVTSATNASGTTTSFSYNPTGDRTGSAPASGTGASYSWDQADRLVSALPADAPLTGTVGTITYSYGATGLLYSRSSAAGSSYMTWDASSGLPLLLSDGTNDYLYGPAGTPVEQANLASGATEYYLSDRQGSTLGLIGASGSLDASFAYDAYGNLSSTSGAASTPLLYDGQYLDQATGFYYLRARWYDPGSDEFLGVDPDVAETGEPFSYAGDDPVNEGDPSGDVSLGFCAGAETHILFLQLGAGDCLTEILNGSNKGQVGIVGTAAAGLGIGLGAGVKFYLQVSNADSLDELGSWFTYFAATASLGGGVTGTFFWNNHWSGQVIFGGDVGVEEGALISGALGESYTWVKVINGWFGLAGDAARGAFGILKYLFLPRGFDVQSELNHAKTIADKYHSGDGQSKCPS